MCRNDPPRTELDDFREIPWARVKYGDKWKDHLVARLYGISKLPTIPVYMFYDTFYRNPVPPLISFPIALPCTLIYNTFWTLGDIVCPELWAEMYD